MHECFVLHLHTNMHVCLCVFILHLSLRCGWGWLGWAVVLCVLESSCDSLKACSTHNMQEKCFLCSFNGWG